MPKCADCKWVMVHTVDPMKGICTNKRIKLAETQANQMAIAKHVVNMDDEACDKFEAGKMTFREMV
ncbi:benzylsuccinate synthase beta subunit family protein [Desulfoscipio gibsoniae]|uniref:Benzylsuccinate synthase beta subunit domain-containing protein n=1 Tax=Desulfoscipio gibsoniae DSM 7213 TaxID=767817 RepID=R4KEW0_9FIRM|nr:benzylsuccinate synthase beta subunit family protein [Desulfoscipio gibsoniae]AGL00207.1 hypothetical protein Desgi_0652 [Desulfoscipio gibsoniae DSM 7213]